MKTLKIPLVDGPRPGRGGARVGAGRPRGATSATGAKVPAPTQEKAALLALWKAEVGRQFPDLVAAQIASARGITHMMARDDNGKWQSVTDPVKMAERLNAGSEFYRLTAVAPSAQMMVSVMDRMFGSPKASLELEVTQAPTELSDDELAAGLVALLDKLKKPDDAP